ncbi:MULTISPECIES: hypothetical protein [unclassified Exiguobacterium]|uniref:hypothetical protein n=1 Tax=unclassified Exiguobacterium TaxID=2644629 RepID=UPI001BE806C2|nr:MULTISPECIES: hypothetical protein [unclassified Exiguobacterium]
MFKYNREKAEKLIEGLRADGTDVTIENLDKYLHNGGVLVSVHVGRIRGNMELTPEVLGIDASQTSLTKFFSDYAKNGSLTFIPVAYEKELKKIESRIRMAKTRMAVGYENSYMPLTTYNDFKVKLNEAQRDYEECRDKIIKDWNNILDQFEMTLDNALTSLNPTRRDELKSFILRRIPSVQDYRDSFYLTVSVKAFPVMENVNLPTEELNEQVKQTAIEDNIRMVHEVLGGALNEAFETVNVVFASFTKNGKVAPKTHGALKDAVKRVKERDMFKNPMIQRITDEMNELSLQVMSRDVPEMCENLMSKIYGYAKEISVHGYINTKDSLMKPSDMEILYQTMT